MYPLGDCRPIYWRTSWYISISAALLADAWSTLDQLDRPMRGPSPEFQASSVNLLLSGAVSSGGFSSKFQVKFICLLFLPSSLPSIIELCSFCHGWKDLFLLQKLDGSHKGYKGCRSDSAGGYTVNTDQGGMNQQTCVFCSGCWLPYMYIYVHCYCGAFILSSMLTRLIYFILLSFLAHFCAWRLHP